MSGLLPRAGAELGDGLGEMVAALARQPQCERRGVMQMALEGACRRRSTSGSEINLQKIPELVVNLGLASVDVASAHGHQPCQSAAEPYFILRAPSSPM